MKNSLLQDKKQDATENQKSSQIITQIKFLRTKQLVKQSGSSLNIQGMQTVYNKNVETVLEMNNELCYDKKKLASFYNKFFTYVDYTPSQ